jgi:DNA-binding MurR/RpiR family transcriptional regulator
MQLMTASTLKPKDVAIGISHTGSVKQTVEVTEAAAKAGATTICITDEINSSLTKVSDIHLITSGRKSALLSGMQSARIAHLGVIDVLYVALALMQSEPAFESMEKMTDATISTRF